VIGLDIQMTLAPILIKMFSKSNTQLNQLLIKCIIRLRPLSLHGTLIKHGGLLKTLISDVSRIHGEKKLD